jgi:predicted phage terminase large subunit-like protein
VSSVLKAGTGITNVVIVGTLLHPKSMLAKLIDNRISPSWTGLKYQAVTSWAKRTDLWDRWEAIYCNRLDHQGASGPAAAKAMFLANSPAMLDGTEVLWAELEGYYALMVQRVSEGPAPFAAEKQNEPLDLLNAAFREHEIQFWDDPVSGQFKTVDDLLNSDPRRFFIVGACDPSLGKPGGDDSAIVTLAVHYHTKKMYVIGADILRRRPDATLDAILTLHRMRKFSVFGVEEVQFQQFLKTELERRARALNLYFRIKGVKQASDKGARIARLQPLLAAGHLMLSKRHMTLVNQMLEFPTGRRDDGPDALEMAVRLVDMRAYGGAIVTGNVIW